MLADEGLKCLSCNINLEAPDIHYIGVKAVLVCSFCKKPVVYRSFWKRLKHRIKSRSNVLSLYK